jgi:hypothetical protein
MTPKDLIDFLQTDLAIAPREIEIAQRKAQRIAGPLHIVLWQLGLISLSQLELVLEWMECHS